MKTIFIALCLLVVSCVPQTKKSAPTEVSTTEVSTTETTKNTTKGSAPIIIGEDSTPGREPLSTKDIGTINEGEVIEMSFNIKNERKLPLIIFNATASCGCTSVSYDKEPIKSGGTKKLNVTYDSKSKSGQQSILINLVTDDGNYVIKMNLFVKNK